MLAAAALLCLLALVPTMARAATGSISGVVTDGPAVEETVGCELEESEEEEAVPCEEKIVIGNGVEGVEVCAWVLSLEEPGEEEEFWGRCDETGFEGKYTLANLPAGEYEVEFWASHLGYKGQYYDGKEHWWEADPVVVGSGPTTGIDAELIRSAGIEGTVTRSSDGEPVEEVTVCAWKAVSEEFGGCDWTGPDGSYLISELEPGEWNVEFWTGETGQNLAFQFYDHKDHWVEADEVVVEAGEVTTGIDAELDAGATISGAVSSAATGAGLEEIVVCSIDALSDQLMTCTWTNWNGEYELQLLPKGEYKVAFSLDLNEWFEEEIFEEMDDGFSTEFWNNQSTLAAADTISIATGDSVSGIDASLDSPAPPPPGTPPPPVVVTPSGVTPPANPPRKRKKCRRGYKKVRVHGKRRCVKKRKHHRHRHAAGGAARVIQAPVPQRTFRFSR
jgi:hypothetical protein